MLDKIQLNEQKLVMKKRNIKKQMIYVLWLLRYVRRCLLNIERVGAFLIDEGRLFQAVGPDILIENIVY